jgi:Mg2+ and Co2+ transporter CorA
MNLIAIKNTATGELNDKESLVIKRMVITYNHHINTPLTIARMTLVRMHQNSPCESNEFLIGCLDRIADTTKKMRELLEENPEIEPYTRASSMYKIGE